MVGRSFRTCWRYSSAIFFLGCEAPGRRFFAQLPRGARNHRPRAGSVQRGRSL